MSKGLFGGMFDFNGDGDLNAFEMAAECQTIRTPIAMIRLVPMTMVTTIFKE